MEGQFFDWATTGTFVGCVGITIMLTAFVKKFIKTNSDGTYKFPIEVVSFIIAVVLMIGASIWFGTFSWSSVILAIINGVLVSLSANGGYDNTKKIIDKNE